MADLITLLRTKDCLVTYCKEYDERWADDELLENIGLRSGGIFNKRMAEFEAAGFIQSFIPYGKKVKNHYYRIIDEYTLFYLTWIAKKSINPIAKHIDDHYWEVLSTKPAWKAWAGLAFEAICFKHINQIKKALHIPDGSDASSWKYISDKEKESGAQIDLVFDRPDNIVNLCEIKYCSAPFVIDKKVAAHLMSREKIYAKVTKTNKQLFLSMVVSGGLKKTMYSEELIVSVVTLDDLFKS